MVPCVLDLAMSRCTYRPWIQQWNCCSNIIEGARLGSNLGSGYRREPINALYSDQRTDVRFRG
jgi:hypothetical protein